MVGIDTNIVIRLLTSDDEPQYRKALTLFKENDIFIPETVILESAWVLRHAYNFSPDEICTALAKLFGLPNVQIPQPDVIAQALDFTRQGLDFADALHLSACGNCQRFATFDTALIKRAKGLSKCPAGKP